MGAPGRQSSSGDGRRVTRLDCLVRETKSGGEENEIASAQKMKRRET